MIKVLLGPAVHSCHRNIVSSLISNNHIRYLSLLEQYEQRVASGAILNDSYQRNVIFCLNELLRNISQWYNVLSRQPSTSSALKNIFSPFLLLSSKRKMATPKGVYIFGDVGCGKTFLMDLFYESCPVIEKTRMHFHVFMKHVHSSKYWLLMIELFSLKRLSNPPSDAISEFAATLVTESRVLCLDEFQVTDIADAMILTRLFKELFKHAFILVTTSNRPPDKLYENGLQRENFLPCIELLKTHCEIFPLASGNDYRISNKIENIPSQTYFYPINEVNNDMMEKIFLNLIGTSKVEPVTLKVFDRPWKIPNACGNVAKFTFFDLCGQPFGPSDYTELSKRFQIIFIVNIPRLNSSLKSEARRFISLIDALYEQKVLLFCTAETHFKDLFDFSEKDADNLSSGTNEVLAFKRTLSRLFEMFSTKWNQDTFGTKYSNIFRCSFNP